MLEMIMSFVYRIREREEGQALVEYALILALVSVVSVGALTALGLGISDLFDGILADL